MTPEKNPVFAVDVLAALRRRLPGAVAVFAGAGDLEAAVRARADELGLSDAVRLIGWRDDIAEVMSASDWFVLPHPHAPMEGFGIAVVEAQLAGLRLLLSLGVSDAPILPGASCRRLSLDDGADAWGAAAARALAGADPFAGGHARGLPTLADGPGPRAGRLVSAAHRRATMPPSLTERLGAGEFEFGLSAAQSSYYWLERRLGDALFRRPPPDVGQPALLNLGCGTHIFEGWVNADDYAFKRGVREPAFRPNWRLDITCAWRCPPDRWDGVFTEHVLEHLSYSQAILALNECLRTMKPGAWLRISVPDLRAYVDLYDGRDSRPEFACFPHPAVGVSFLTQMHLHRSTWDADLLVRVLAELGFDDACASSFGIGADARLVRDDPDKSHESLYVEARKP